MKIFLKLLLGFTAVFIWSTMLGAATGWNPLAIGGVSTGLSLLTPSGTGFAFAGLNKEIWLPEIMEGFYADDSFLSEARDMTAFVDNNKIHLAEAGVNPTVLVNNTAYPIAVAQRGDTPLELSLHTYDTQNTIVRNIETAELSYDKRASVMYGHKQALRMETLTTAIHSYGPTSDSQYTPVLESTNSGKITFEDILKLEEAFDNAEIEPSGRVLVLSVSHRSDLRKENLKLYKEFMKEKELFGFKIYKLANKRMPKYNNTTGVKVGYGVASAGTDAVCSIAFQKDEVMKADGTIDMFIDEKSAKERGDIIGFQKRGIALPIRGKGIGAIYTKA